MNIVTLEVLLHCFYRVEAFPYDSPAAQDAHAWLQSNELIEESIRSRVVNEGSQGPLIEPRTYRVTERGRVYINALISVPLPVLAWRMPIPDERKG
jgi:hypothetical protein